jgi:hypothetical protein
VIAKTKACTVCLQNYFVCVIANTAGYFMIAKKAWTVSVCSYFVCVITNNAGNFMIAKKA